MTSCFACIQAICDIAMQVLKKKQLDGVRLEVHLVYNLSLIVAEEG